MAHYEDLTIDQGTDVVIQLELFNPDGSRKQLINWDSDAGQFGAFYDMRGKIKKSYNSTDSAEAFICTAFNPANQENILQISLTNVQTTRMKAGRYVYDVELEGIDSSTGIGVVERILEGKLTLSPQVTT
tara:strand:- start:15 stop:404 length:390 start_codon:yes stop_codon:yes gene_type:complete